MPKAQPLIINLPFCGFYCSPLSQAVDNEETQWVEYHCDPQGESGFDYEPNYPEPLRISSDEMSGLIFDVSDYSTSWDKLARWYVDAFDVVAGQAFGLSKAGWQGRWSAERGHFRQRYRQPSIGLQFESMKSPREYNFETDRLFAFIPRRVVRELWRRSKANGHKALGAVIEERHSSRSGFVSYYSNDAGDWTAKPVLTWDHNELCTLLIACLRLAGMTEGDAEEAAQYATLNDGGSDQAWEAAVDWPKFDQRRDELRADKLADWRAADPTAADDWAREAGIRAAQERDQASPDLFGEAHQ